MLYFFLFITRSFAYVRNHRHLPFGRKNQSSLYQLETKTWADFKWKHSHGGNPPNWFVQKDSCSHRSYSIEQGEPLTKKTCGPPPMVPSRAIPRYSNLNSRFPTGFGRHHPCCVLWAAGANFTLRLLSHRHPVLKLSEDGCPFKKNSRKVSEVHPTAGKCPLGSMLSIRYTLLPPGYAGKVSSEFIPKWFLQSDHVDEAVCNLLAKDYTLCHHFHTLLSRLSSYTCS